MTVDPRISAAVVEAGAIAMVRAKIITTRNWEEMGTDIQEDVRLRVRHALEAALAQIDRERPTGVGEYVVGVAQQAYDDGFKAGRERPEPAEEVLEAMCRAANPAMWAQFDRHLAAPDQAGSHKWSRDRMHVEIAAMRQALAAQTALSQTGERK
jgi:hypothetical protein